MGADFRKDFFFQSRNKKVVEIENWILKKKMMNMVRFSLRRR